MLHLKKLEIKGETAQYQTQKRTEFKSLCHNMLLTLSGDEVQWSVESTFSVHVLPKKYIRKHYIIVTLATLADYIIEHQWESWDVCIETPAEVIGYKNSG